MADTQTDWLELTGRAFVAFMFATCATIALLFVSSWLPQGPFTAVALALWIADSCIVGAIFYLLTRHVAVSLVAAAVVPAVYVFVVLVALSILVTESGS